MPSDRRQHAALVPVALALLVICCAFVAFSCHSGTAGRTPTPSTSPTPTPSPTPSATATQAPSDSGALPATVVATVVRALPPPPAAGIASPLSVTAALGSTICVVGIVNITATVRDGNGNPVSGAMVTGQMQNGAGSQVISFLPTNGNGSTTSPVNIAQTRSSSIISWTVDASAGGLRATAMTTCGVP